nr:membrane integrity-associated transporter subunit PqiC [Aeromonadaceae bacterium]
FQPDDVQIVTANQARWAEALDKQLTRSLVQSLSEQLERVQVLEGPNAKSQVWHLNLEITAFQGRFDGQAVVAGRWVLQQGDKAYSHSFQTQVPLQEDGYPALVRALRKGWQSEIDSLVVAIKPTLVPAH